jgi:hypothetical protein
MDLPPEKYYRTVSAKSANGYQFKYKAVEENESNIAEKNTKFLQMEK